VHGVAARLAKSGLPVANGKNFRAVLEMLEGRRETLVVELQRPFGVVILIRVQHRNGALDRCEVDRKTSGWCSEPCTALFPAPETGWLKRSMHPAHTCISLIHTHRVES
jgi:hypothetical protein